MNEFGRLELRWIQGFANRNTEFVENKTVCYTCGNHICFLNLETRTQNAFPSPGRGISALTANGNSGIFAFSEEKLSPSIYVYTFPELQMKNELKGGAQLDYTCLALSHSGPYLGSCSSLPDHIITVWNWENAEPLCSQPQAGQDVVSLAFNPMNWLELCALGTASLTVWNITKSGSLHVLEPSVIELPVPDGTFAESQAPSSQNVSSIMAKLHQSTRARLTPSAICWTATSKLYVGCAEGFLLLVDPESPSVSVLFNPTSADAIPELRRNSFQCLTPNKNGLIAVGKESVAHLLQIKGTEINIEQTWLLEKPVTTVMYSPDYKKILFSSNSGQIYVLNPAQSDRIVKIFDVLSDNFVTATLLHNDKNICVSLKESGELQLWSSDGICISSLLLQAEVTCVACCPIAHYAAVGTATGKVLFIDLNQEQRPRLVHQVLLYHTAVDHLVFDNDGHYLFTSGSDSHIYVLEARPSKMFSVIGFTVLPGCILSLSAQCNRDNNKVKVLALCAGDEDRKKDGSLLTVLSLATQNLAGPDCVDRHGRLSSHVLKVFTFRVPRPLKSSVLGLSEIFAYCHGSKTLQRFVLPEDKGDLSKQKSVELKPVQEVRGHPLGPASLALSPHCLWLASVGRDGLLRIRETASMELYIELQCHSCRLGGVRSVSFSTDGCTLLTVGLKDGSLVCTNIRVKGGDVSKMNEATQYSKSTAHFLKNIFDTENPILINFPVWGQVSPVGTEIPEVSGGPSVDVTERDGGDENLPRAPPSQPTWLESRREGLLKEDEEQCSEKKNLMETIKELRDSIQEIIRDSEDQTEHFNMDVEEERRLKAMVEQGVMGVRTEIEWDILEKCYLWDVLKRESWDTMKVISRTIKAFHSDLEVLNYPLKERTEKELEDLCRVQNMRKLEKAAGSLGSLKKDLSAQEEEEEKKVQEAESSAVMGSISAQLGYSNPYVYDQFSMKTIEQRINQIILLQDVIYRIKTGFNTDFEALHKQKMQEIKCVKDRNKHIREIMLQLDVHEELWEPGLTNSEWPERLLTVEDSEIKAERYFTKEQKEEKERRKLEEERRSAAQADDPRKRALHDMMDGVLEVKKEDILKMEIPPPEFVLTKPDIQWSEEEKKAFKEHEKKTKELSEEKEKYKKLLEIEIKKLHQSSKEATERFNKNLAKLLEKKVNCTVAIYQEELKIAYLVKSVLREEEMRSQEQELKLKLEKMLAYKDGTGERLKKLEEEVEFLQDTYDNIVRNDKSLDKDFRKVFAEFQSQMVDYLYKMFKHRPSTEKMRAQMDNSNNSDTFKEHRLCGSQAPDALSQMLRAMDELDAPANMPEGLSKVAWERFCHIRRTKVESEHKVKTKALTLAEMQAFLQKSRKADKGAQEEIKNLSEALESLHRKRTDLLMDTMVQVILEQKQVKVTTTDPTAYNVDTHFILYHRSVVVNLRNVIKTLAEKKIASMVARKDVRKGIIPLEREQKEMRKQIEDLKHKAKNIKMLRLSKEQHTMTQCSKADQESHKSKQISSLEKSIALMETAHKKSVQRRLQKIEKVNKQSAAKAHKRANLEQQLPEIQVTMSELAHMYEAAGSEENEAAGKEERYQEVVKRSRLKELARYQAENLAFLWAEVEFVNMKNFPSLHQLKH